MSQVWRNVWVSNRTPYPYERITISGEFWFGSKPVPYFPAFLMIDEREVGMKETDRNGHVYFTIGAPGVPGPYTYVLVAWWGAYNPIKAYVGIEVVPYEEKKIGKKEVLMGIIIGLEIGVGLMLLSRR